MLQLVLSPVAVARLEKTILEALMTRVLNISATRWKVLVKEHDVPCAALAFEELREMFKHITQLSAEYSDLKFPEVELTIVSTKEFAQSSLHLNHRVLVGEYHSNAEYDMVIDLPCCDEMAWKILILRTINVKTNVISTSVLHTTIETTVKSIRLIEFCINRLPHKTIKDDMRILRIM